jgi:hypothetical protein
LLCYLLTGNIEHIIINEENVNILQLNQLLEAELGFGTTLSYPLIPTLAALLISFIVPFRWLTQIKPLWSLYNLLLITLLGLMVPSNENAALWKQSHLIESNLRLIHQLNRPPPKISPLTYKEKRNIYHMDLTGEPIVELAPKKPLNVLIITTEALSYEHMRMGWTPYLAEHAQNTLFYSNFIAPSRFTMAGQYNILCGDLPRLNLMPPGMRQYKPVMMIRSAYEQYNCLPQILKKSGYATTFLQSTTLNYINTRSLIQKVGFEKTLDGRRLPIWGEWNGGWGVIDSALYENLKDLLQKQDKTKPWFIMSMSEGTHTPFFIPSHCKAKRENASREENTFRCMDESLALMLDWLDHNGYTKDTLILLTSDESNVHGAEKKFPASVLLNNHGFMMVLTPNKDKKWISEIFSLSCPPIIGPDLAS